MLTVGALVMSAAQAACAQPRADWTKGNCVAETGPRTQLALLRAHSDSATIFPVASPTAEVFGAHLRALSVSASGERIYVGPPDGAGFGRRLDARWWDLGRQVHPWFEYADTTAPFAVLQRIDLAPDAVGYVIQLPAVDNSAGRELWIHDVARGCFLLPVPLAHAWGDAGETSLSEAWLVDVNGDGVRDILLHMRSTSVADSAGAIEQVWDSLAVRRWESRGFAAPVAVPADQYQWARGSRPSGRPR